MAKTIGWSYSILNMNAKLNSKYLGRNHENIFIANRVPRPLPNFFYGYKQIRKIKRY